MVFGISMGFFEAAVVIYLRELYYPHEFSFPMVPIPQKIALTEILRETASLLMLLSVSLVTGKDNIRRLAYFLLTFATWDITYYLFLKLILKWPAAITDWDILFLIPFPWYAPVLAPCIASTMMLIFSFSLIKSPEMPLTKLIRPVHMILLLGGCLLIITSFTADHLSQAYKMIIEPSTSLIPNIIPDQFLWGIFIAGLLLIVYVNYIVVKKSGKNMIHETK
jgi:hypothetical protein